MPPILLYDGICGLCNRFVQFVLRRDRKAIFRFASLQSAFSGKILARHGADPSELDTVYIVLNHELPDERLLSRSSALIFILENLGTLWHTASSVLQIVPKFLRDSFYNFIARHRYRLFGRSDVCSLLCDRDHRRFLDQ